MNLHNTAKVECSRLDWESLQSHLSRDSIVIVESILQQATPDTIAFLGTTNPERFHEHTSTVLKAISTVDSSLCRNSVEQLAGLGVGLTPAGDDYLIGVMYALWTMRPEVEARRWAGMIASVAAPLTTSLSAEWLRAAARGEAASPWHELIDALAGGEVRTIRQAARQILATGHTSGAAALVGFVAACQALVSAVQ